ncbi:MAG: hypothetical protein RRA94_07270, partial [Bacteroidota bacterium]|nr:hypothetical protein [Bacteroidota bacterium]
MRNVIILFAIVAMALPAQAQDALYGYEKGTEYKYLIEQTGLQIQEAQGQSRTSNREITISSVLTVEEKLDGGHQKMKMLVENALAIIEGPQQTQTLGPEAAGKSVIFELDAQGDIVDVDSSVMELEPETRGIVMASTNIFPTFDAGKLSVGSEWESTEIDTAGDGGETEIITETERTYTVKGEKEINGHKCFEIHIASEADIEGKQVMGEQEIMVSGTREGMTKV